jgi:hypothetical protein
MCEFLCEFFVSIPSPPTKRNTTLRPARQGAGVRALPAVSGSAKTQLFA